jgi:predicted DNA-binding protein (MmcQ/YjbR family)
MNAQEWDKLMQEYRASVEELNTAVKRSRRLVGKEFEEEHQRIEDAKRRCENARQAMLGYLRSGS